MAPLRPYGYGHHVVRGRRMPYSLYPQMRLLVFLDLAYEQGIRTRLVLRAMLMGRCVACAAVRRIAWGRA